ncbi:hypothetical protein KIPB_012590, partial [Kipferlia bialata]|eukprot:g12590.t1
MSIDDIKVVMDELCVQMFDTQKVALAYCENTYNTILDLEGQGYPSDVACEMMGRCSGVEVEGQDSCGTCTVIADYIQTIIDSEPDMSIDDIK